MSPELCPSPSHLLHTGDSRSGGTEPSLTPGWVCTGCDGQSCEAGEAETLLVMGKLRQGGQWRWLGWLCLGSAAPEASLQGELLPGLSQGGSSAGHSQNSSLARWPSCQAWQSAHHAGQLWQQPEEGASTQAAHKSPAACVSLGSDLGGPRLMDYPFNPTSP